MPYPFTEEQRRLRETLRTFALEEVIPGAAERDRTAAYPAQLVARLAELGLMGITIPEEYDGLGLDTPTQLVAMEEVAYGDAALASIYTGHYLGMEGLLLYGDDEQKRRYLAPLARGEQLAGFALTETDAGSDVASIRTEARRAPAGWLIRGSKVFISNAREAGLLLLFAKTDRDAGLDGIGAFAVPTDAAGISYSQPQDKLGIRSAPTYELRLEDVAVESDALIGGEGAGGRIALEVLNRARIDIAAMANGIAMRALQLAADYAAERRQFRRPIRDFQAVQLLLAEMDVAVETGRLAACLRRDASIAKYVATENCFACVDRALQIHGGYGYMRESEVERLYRDCRILRIYEGTSQIQLLTIARALARRRDENGAVV